MTNDLRPVLRQRGFSQASVAREIKAEPAHLNRVLAGKAGCSEAMAKAIHRATNGALPCWELRPDLWSPGQVPPGLTVPPEAA